MREVWGEAYICCASFAWETCEGRLFGVKWTEATLWPWSQWKAADRSGNHVQKSSQLVLSESLVAGQKWAGVYVYVRFIFTDWP